MVNSSFSLTWDSLQAFLSGRMYMPHGNCYLWQTPLVGLHLVANALTAIAYFSIPIMLVYFVRKRQNMPFSRVFLLFSAFITACGVGHLLDMVTLWFPIYWIDGFERSFTALVSCYTAVELYTLLPKFLALKSPEELALINQQLQVEIQERKKAESILSRILEGTAAVTGRDFFAAFVENLAIALNVRQVEISEILSSPPDTRQILATWENPQFAAPQGSLPQEAIASQALKFPIRDREARSIGCLQIHYDQAAINQEQTTKLITIFAARAAAEIERKRALDELAHANNQLEAINNQLEEKVAERTIALKTVNQTLKTRIERLRLTEDALRSSEARYRSLVLNIPGAVYRCLPDEQWTMEFLSNGIEAITGYLATDFLNNQIRPFGAIIHPEDHDRTLASLKSITPAQPTFTDEYRLIRRDQSICWVFEQGRGIFDHDDTLVRLEGVMIEVTDRKLASQALEQERRQLRQLIRNMPVAVAMLDEHLCYVAHSHQWLVDYHLQVESLLGRSHLQVFPQFTQKHQANLQQALGGQVISCDEDVYIQGDGTKQYLKWTIQPWYYQENQVGGVVIVTQNINDLVEGREAALAASRLKSRFLANMSHEIRTPMNGILGIAELLQTTHLNSQQQDFIKTLTQSANHLLYLINDILDFSKLEAGEMRLESIALDVVDCVESVAELLAFQAQTKQVEVITNIDPGLRGTLQGDPVRLRQILTNLVGNGIKFTHQGSVTIRVFPVVDHETSVLVRFEVKDTGIGIDQADQEKLFRSFSQVDPSTTRQYGGTGLGLAIAQHLVSLMGGTIGLDSAPGQGSTFWFTACFSRLEAPPPLPQLAPYRVLLIDSHPLSLQATQGYLSHCGVSVIAHGDFMGGILALEQAVSIDLILLALPILGNQTGIEAVLEKVKGLLPRDNLVLLVSAVDYTRLKNWIQNQGIRYLLKPIQQKALLACLQAPVTTNPTSEVELTLTEILDAEAQRSPEISILVVEDTPINQTVVLNQLDLMGFRDVDCVNNGREALEQLRHKTYDLVLMDCLMPELDGYSTTKVIRDQEQGEAHQLIIAMTANAMKGDREKCLAAGMDGYIAKPISLDTLHQVIDQCLQKLPHRRPISPLKQVAPKVLAGAIVPAPGEADLPINLPRLTQLYGDNPRFYREMFKQFMTFAPGYIEALRGAIAGKDPQQISYEAHRLKGATSSVSIRKIPEWCTAIELAIPEQNYVTLERLMGNIHDYFEEVTQFINHYFES